MNKISIVINQKDNITAALKIKKKIKQTIIWAPKHLALGHDFCHFKELSSHLRFLYSSNVAIIAFLALPILIRILAPIVKNKNTEPAVITINTQQGFAIPLLGIHQNLGGNYLASLCSEILNITPILTNAGDNVLSPKLLAMDDSPYVLVNKSNYKNFIMRLLEEKKIALETDGDYFHDCFEDLPIKIDVNAKLKIISGIKKPLTKTTHNALIYAPKRIVLGVGCKRNASGEKLIELVETTLKRHNYLKESIALIASIDIKEDEKAIQELSQFLAVPARFFSASELNQVKEKLVNPSAFTYDTTGAFGVAEGACLLVSDKLIVEKTSNKSAAIAMGLAGKAIEPQKFGRKRGKLYIIGIGPGSQSLLSKKTFEALNESTEILGYTLYLKLIAELIEDKKQHHFDIGKENLRALKAIELAHQGKTIALVSSGDAGIYAMASIALKTIEEKFTKSRIEIKIIPAISAMQALAAKTGAPLNNDFTAISLSDLLTPRHIIEKRIINTAKSDLAIALFNPASSKRKELLAFTHKILTKYRPPQTPIIIGKNLYRKNEYIEITTLDKWNIQNVDMFTTIIVGSVNAVIGKQYDIVYNKDFDEK